MAELWTTAADAVRALAAADPGLRRFGAAQHRYALAPPLSAADIAALERRLGAELPEELRGFAGEFAAGGAGPGYGIVPLDLALGDAIGRATGAGLGDATGAGLGRATGAGLGDTNRGAVDRAADVTVTAPAGAPWTRGLPLAHLGCGYTAVVVLDGSARGEIWIDARAAGVIRPIAADFTALYLDWIDRLAHARWPEPAVPPGSCALAAALSSYLARCEAEAGAAPGTLAGAPLRAALSHLRPGAIEITAAAVVGAARWFDDGDRVDPCIACARLIENLGDDGLRREAIAAGALPRPLRPPR